MITHVRASVTRRGFLRTAGLATGFAATGLGLEGILAARQAPAEPFRQRLEEREKPYLTAPVALADGRCVGLLRLHDTVRAHLAG